MQTNLLEDAQGTEKIERLHGTSSPDEEDKEPHHATHPTDEADKVETHATASQIDEFRPCARSGVFASIGHRRYMEDRHVVMDDAGVLVVNGDDKQTKSVPASFYAVMDGHGAKHAAVFAENHLFSNFLKGLNRWTGIDVALTIAFIMTDLQFRDAWLENKGLASGTTVLAAVIAGNKLYVANAGDCRAVLCRNGRALDMSVDHDPCQNDHEFERIRKAGGYLEEGYLNGKVNMSRALGNWHHEGLKAPDGPLIPIPEIKVECLTEEDEFLIVASDGLFKRKTSQSAVNFVRDQLEKHNHLEECACNLAAHAWEAYDRLDILRDNITIVIISLQKTVSDLPQHDGVRATSSQTEYHQVE